jgi:protein-S-isoprenylcysteine O-methyltransferase Ste14
MTRSAALAFSGLFLLVAPGTLAGLIPYTLTDGWSAPLGPLPLAALGGVLVAGGAVLLLECFSRFALQGRGTPAPVAPPTRLIVTGAYRRVRNPMYVAVVSLVLGQAALFADARLAVYAAVLWLGFHLFVLAYEEPTLRRSFPDDYAAFFAAVPRWIPRLTPWRRG